MPFLRMDDRMNKECMRIDALDRPNGHRNAQSGFGGGPRTGESHRHDAEDIETAPDA